jgi:hypothetical protein
LIFPSPLGEKVPGRADEGLSVQAISNITNVVLRG